VNPRILRDPVHGYLELSPVEEALLREPVVQRLHWISQNGLAYLTYPSNRTSRFSHSLGAMHVAGAMFRGAVLSSDSNAVSSLVKKIDCVVVLDEAKLKPCVSGQFWTALALPEIKLVPVWQALRLAALVHDLGHLPFSHTMEHVLKAVVAYLEFKKLTLTPLPAGLWALHKWAVDQKMEDVPGAATHELVGLSICTRTLEPAVQGTTYLGFKSLALAKLILSADPKNESPLGALHSLIDGEFDADRADYVLRDSVQSGISDGESYDLYRATNHIVLDREGDRFWFRPTPKAVPALESFCLARFKMWRSLVFHNNVVRSELALSRLLYLYYRLLANGGALPANARGALSSSPLAHAWTFLSMDPAAPVDTKVFQDLDEGMVRWSMQELLRSLQGFGAAEHEREPSLRDLREMLLYLRFVLYREKSRIAPLWKRITGYSQFAGEYLKSLALPPTPTAVIAMNRHLRERLRESVTKKEDPIGTAVGIEGEVSQSSGWPAHMVARLLFHADFKAHLDCWVRISPGQLVKIGDLSPIISSTEGAWESDVHFHGFAINLAGDLSRESEIKETERLELRGSLAPAFGKCIEARKTQT